MKNALNHEAHQTVRAAKVLRAQIEGLAGDDIELIRDSLEGQLDLHEIIRALAAGIGEDLAFIAGLKEYRETLNTRIARFEERIKLRQGLIQSGMEIGELSSLESDLATVSLRRVPASATITEEADVPTKYWKPQPPKLDKKAVLDALKDKQDVPGATLNNGGQTVAIRWR